MRELYNRSENNLCAFAHILGALGCIFIFFMMSEVASVYGTALSNTTMYFYMSGVLLFFLCSVIYHFLKEGKGKKVFRTVNNVSFLLYIPLSYLPLFMLKLSNGWGIAVGIITVLASAADIILNIVSPRKNKKIISVLFLISLWSVYCLSGMIIEATTWFAFVLMALSGVLLTAGMIFYLQKKAYYHLISHFFTMTAVTVQSLFTLLYVLPVDKVL